MLGAIIGDIVGSVYEWNNIKTKDFPLFRDDCFVTDDSIMTLAAAEALMAGGMEADFAAAYRRWGRRYPHADYGGRFRLWLQEEGGPYHSYGNGSAMRVSPCAWAVPLSPVLGEGLEAPLTLAERSAAVTHNHPEGIKGAQATALCIYLARQGRAQGKPEEARALMRRLLTDPEGAFGYDLSRSLDQIRPQYRFDESCQGTVPEAITAFLESDGFEDALRNAVSLGGDSDTLAAITGSVAEAAYGIDEALRSRALSYMDGVQRALFECWEAWLAAQGFAG